MVHGTKVAVGVWVAALLSAGALALALRGPAETSRGATRLPVVKWTMAKALLPEAHVVVLAPPPARAAVAVTVTEAAPRPRDIREMHCSWRPLASSEQSVQVCD